MDPVTLTIITGVAANALTLFVIHVGQKGADFLLDKSSIGALIKDLTNKNSSTSVAIRKAIEEKIKQDALYGIKNKEGIRKFLKSAECEEIVRQVFSVSLSKELGNRKKTTSDIRQEFALMLKAHAGRATKGLEYVANDLFEGIVVICDSILIEAVERGILSAHEAKSAARHNFVLDELANVKKLLGVLTAKNKPGIKDVLDFEKRYRKQVAHRHGHVVPPQFDAANKVPIDSIYVAPNFIQANSKSDKEEERFTAGEFMSVFYRAVILGNPGGGKSTFANKLCHDLATKYEKKIYSDRSVMPILVILRDYGAAKKERACSILDFIELESSSKYQLSPVKGAFEYLLVSGRALLIFDGLDELLDTSTRREISADVEAFCNLYPAVPVLVTSREVGYEQAPLDESRFRKFRLAPFEEEQVRDYADKWFALETGITLNEKEEKVRGFIRESASVSDLRANPLMLALMCNIYRGENYIPRNRPDVYEKCAMMLFERWDKSRGINFLLPIEAHINPTMKFLAYWIYSDVGLQSGVTEKKLVSKAKEYLCPKRFEDPDEAESAAQLFISFCRGRAWVFTDTGTTPEGERLYQFTHRTFLEYFAASYLVRICPTPEKLAKTLLPKISRREWDVVCQLAFQIQNKTVEEAGDKLLGAVLKRFHSKRPEIDWNLLSFAARCLEFIVPKPSTARKVASSWTTASVKLGSDRRSQTSNQAGRAKIKRKKVRYVEDGSEEFEEILSALLWVADENLRTVSDEILKTLTETAKRKNRKEASSAIELGLNLSFGLHRQSFSPRNSGSLERVAFWRGISDNFKNNCFSSMNNLAAYDDVVATELLISGDLEVSRYCATYGTEKLFRDTTYMVFSRVQQFSFLEYLFHSFVSEKLREEVVIDQRQIYDQLGEVGRFLSNTKLPWAKAPSFFRPYISDRLRRSLQKSEVKKRNLEFENPDLVFSLWAFFAGFCEISKSQEKLHAKRRESAGLEVWLDRLNIFPSIIGASIKERSKKSARGLVESSTEFKYLRRNQRKIILQWSSGDICIFGKA